MTTFEKETSTSSAEAATISEIATTPRHDVKWYRSSFYNALILGVCNLLCPGIWGAMNSLGGGGAQEPYLVNAANALTFCLMVFSCFFGSAVVKWIGIKWALVFGAVGFAPYAAGLYTHNRYGIEWLTLLGAALCGISAGIFWMAEAAIALSYPEPYNQGRFLGFWLSFRVGGQVIGGAINLGNNAKKNGAGKVSYSVFEVFIALQALGPFVGFLLNSPSKVQRTDGMPVRLHIKQRTRDELKSMVKLLISRQYLLIVPLIAQAVYAEAVMFSYQNLWFSVRARALGSFVSGIVALTGGNLVGAFLDNRAVSLKTRTRATFIGILTLQGGLWIWGTILATEFNKTQPTYDWIDPGFGKGFTLFLFWVMSFQLNYMYLYFIIGTLAKSEGEVVRYASLLRGTESAAQAVSYGLGSVKIMAAVGNIYLNFGLWAIAVFPAWLVVKDIGVKFGDAKLERES